MTQDGKNNAWGPPRSDPIETIRGVKRHVDQEFIPAEYCNECSRAGGRVVYHKPGECREFRASLA